jgi:YD repeat-containing protein
LLDAVLRQAGPAGALVKRYAYAYDAAGNRTGEQTATDTRVGVHACTKPAAETANTLNQLTARAGGGPVRFAGTLSETGAVSVAGGAAVRFG